MTDRIRPLAIAIVRRSTDGALLVSDGYDKVKNRRFHRPLGGEIGFGETGEQAVRREFEDKISADISDVRTLGVLENVFTHEGKPGHEIVLVYTASLTDRDLYEQKSFSYKAGDTDVAVIWKQLADFEETDPKAAPLVPDGLLALLSG